MSRLTIDVTEQQHQALKAMAALEGKTMKQYALEHLLPRSDASEDKALAELKQLLGRRLEEAKRGEVVNESISTLANKQLSRIDGE